MVGLSQISKALNLMTAIQRIGRRKVFDCSGRIIMGQLQNSLKIGCYCRHLFIGKIGNTCLRLLAGLLCLFQISGPQKDQASQAVSLRLGLQKPDRLT